MKTTSDQLDYLLPEDIRTISEKTHYAVKTIYALLSGSRGPTQRNKVVFEMAYKIAKIRKKSLDMVQRKINELN